MDIKAKFTIECLSDDISHQDIFYYIDRVIQDGLQSCTRGKYHYSHHSTMHPDIHIVSGITPAGTYTFRIWREKK